MPLKTYDQQLPDPSHDAPLWRFMPFNFFQDFMANEELYLRRCDKYKKDDPQDGIPTDDYVRKQLGLRKYDIEDEKALISHQGANRLFTEMYYLSCWNLYTKEHADVAAVCEAGCRRSDDVWAHAGRSEPIS